MSSSRSQVEYVSHTRIGEKGQLTIPRQYRDELGLATGAPIAVLRIGEGLMLIPNTTGFGFFVNPSRPCWSTGNSPRGFAGTLPEARQRVFVRRYPELAGSERAMRRGKHR